MRTVSGWHGKRKSSTTRLIRNMPLTPLRIASGRISWLSLKAKKDKRSLKHGNVSRTRRTWNRKISSRPHKKNSVRVNDKTLAEFFRYGGLSHSALGRSPSPPAVFKIIVVEGKKNPNPFPLWKIQFGLYAFGAGNRTGFSRLVAARSAPFSSPTGA